MIFKNKAYLCETALINLTYCKLCALQYYVTSFTAKYLNANIPRLRLRFLSSSYVAIAR
jgi:hypothetical protein